MRERRDAGARGRHGRLPARLVRGAAAGLLATSPMSVVLWGGRRALPRAQRYAMPPTEITGEVAEAVGIAAATRGRGLQAATTLAPTGYGSLVGAAHGALFPRLGRAAVPVGAGYGLLVFGVSYLGWLPALGILAPANPPPAPANGTQRHSATSSSASRPR